MMKRWRWNGPAGSPARGRRGWAALAGCAVVAAVALLAVDAGIFGGSGEPGRFGGSGLAFAREPVEATFPHAKHARLFPTCQGCHTGIERGDAEAHYPTPALCANCHDGVERHTVDWQGPTRGPSNLRFSHPEHIRESGRRGEPVSCMGCHGEDGAESRWMRVAAAQPENCLSCHAHRAEAHLAASNRCSVCHLPVTEAKALSAGRIAQFPKPEWHESPDFLLEHGRGLGTAVLAARGESAPAPNCAVCHARQSCERCHLDASARPAIMALAPDDRVALLVRDLPPEYPVPPSHERADWLSRHGGVAAADVQRCSTCHAASSCTSCHIGSGGQQVIASLPEARPDGPSGVLLRALPGRLRIGSAAEPGAMRGMAPGSSRGRAPERRDPVHTPDSLRIAALGPEAVSLPERGRHATERVVRVHPAGFDRSHGAAAASDQMRCTGCHEQRTFCAECHTGASRPGFHPANFVARHAAEAYSRDLNCTSCHNTETFCRACHIETGRGSSGPLQAGYHNAQPLWILQHAQAARQNLETCTSCHVQRDCMQCHSQVGGRGISPHGPGFDADRAASKNAVVCFRCHYGGPPR